MFSITVMVWRLVIGFIVFVPIVIGMAFISFFVALYDMATDLSGMNKPNIFKDE